MKKDLLLTFVCEGIALFSGLLVYKFAANLPGKEGFSQYALCRRTIALILPVFLMGLTVGIPRYMAFAGSNKQYPCPDHYFLAGSSLVLTSTLLSVGLLNAFSGPFAFLLLGNSAYNCLILPISLMVVGLILHALCYSYYRGKLLMAKANMLQLVNLGIIPLSVFTHQNDVVRILLLTGLLWITTSVATLSLIFKNMQWGETRHLLGCAKELVFYGIQRVPGDFGMAALISLPALITAHICGIKNAGYVAFGTSVMNMTGAVFAPFGLVFLPKASQLIAHKDKAKLKGYVTKLSYLTVSLNLTGLIIFEIFAPEIIGSYLGGTFIELVFVTRIIMLGSLAYTFYVSMRSILDAYYTKAVNTMNIIISLTVFATASFLILISNGHHMVLIGSFVIALYTLGILTAFSIRNTLNTM